MQWQALLPIFHRFRFGEAGIRKSISSAIDQCTVKFRLKAFDKRAHVAACADNQIGQ